MIRISPAYRAPSGPPRWTIVVPFKGGAAAKSRLGQGPTGVPGFRSDVRRQLALAFLCDTVGAAAAVPDVARVIVVSSDPALVAAVPGIVLVSDPGQGLNAAAAAGIQWARKQDPDRAVAILAGDLPCLEPGDLTVALALAARHPLSLVPDRHGTGTTLLTAQPGTEVTPRFGQHSCDAHRRLGHTVLPLPTASTLRHDVDTIADLDLAMGIGVGGYTRSTVLHQLPSAYGGQPADKGLAPLPAAG